MYEPVVVIGEDQPARMTSLAALRDVGAIGLGALSVQDAACVQRGLSPGADSHDYVRMTVAEAP